LFAIFPVERKCSQIATEPFRVSVFCMMRENDSASICVSSTLSIARPASVSGASTTAAFRGLEVGLSRQNSVDTLNLVWPDFERTFRRCGPTLSRTSRSNAMHFSTCSSVPLLKFEGVRVHPARLPDYLIIGSRKTSDPVGEDWAVWNGALRTISPARVVLTACPIIAGEDNRRWNF
jgi:hypothetical protein